MTFKGFLRAGCAAAGLFVGAPAIAQIDTGQRASYDYDPPAIPENVCLYRHKRPVWHFIPANQVDSDVRLALARQDFYPVLRESGGIVSQDDLVQGRVADVGDLKALENAQAQLDFMRNNLELDERDLEAMRSKKCYEAFETEIPFEDDKGNITDDARKAQAEIIAALGLMIATGEKSGIPNACRRPNGNEFIRSLAEELTEAEETFRNVGEDLAAPIPYGSTLLPRQHYLRVSVVQANLSFDRRFFKKFYPALYSEIELDQFGGITAKGISAEDGDFRHDRGRVGRTQLLNRVILPPTPYIDGPMDMKLSIMAVESQDYGRTFLNFLSGITKTASSSLLTEAIKVFDIVDAGIQQLASTNDQNQFLEGGVTASVPRPQTGYWLLLWPSKDFMKAYARPESTACREETPKADRAPFRTLVQNVTGGREAFTVNDLFYIAKAGPSDVRLLVKRKVLDEEKKPVVQTIRKVKKPLLDKEGKPSFDAKGEPLYVFVDEKIVTETPDYQFEPFDNASWALIRIDGLTGNPNWQRIPGLLDAQQKIVSRMLTFYLPDFTRTESYLDFEGPFVENEKDVGANGGNTTNGKTTPASGTDEETEEEKKKEKKEQKRDEEAFKKQLTKDLQFFYGIIASSPDLHREDKHKIMKREQERFQRHLHILRTTELRDKLIAEGYRRWRESSRLRACNLLNETFPGVPGPGGEFDPCKKDEKKKPPTEPKDKKKDPAPAGDGQQPGQTNQSQLELSPEFASANLVVQAAGLSDAVDQFMADRPTFAYVSGFNDAESISAKIIGDVLRHPDGGAVREHAAAYVRAMLIMDVALNPNGIQNQLLPTDYRPQTPILAPPALE